METYSQFKDRHEKIRNSIPLGFCFSNKQFKEMMTKFGLNETDTKEICSIGGGGYIKKTDAHLLTDAFKLKESEFAAAIAADLTGENFIFQSFNSELSNHEFCYTLDPTDAIETLGFSMNDIKHNSTLSHGFSLAIKRQREKE